MAAMDQYSTTLDSQSQRAYSFRESSTIASFDQQHQDGVSYMPSLPEDEDGGQDEVATRWAARFVIAVDYGTTYTGVAWILTDGNEPTLDDIHHVFNWPGNRIEAKVPSRFTYSPIRGTDRWGNGIGSDALVIRWTKLELELPKRDKALEILRETISETPRMKLDPRTKAFKAIPAHLVMTSEDTVTDYLTGVLTYARRDIERVTDYTNLTSKTIDLVITHPAVWDARAKNTTFRAVTTAFDNAFREVDYRLGNIRLATESEACAQYLMKEARDRNLARLRVGECFIVVDAGGGTVDLAAYQVEEVSPRFRMRRVTTPLSSRCGATEIDRYFLKTFLSNRLSPEDFATLRGGETNSHAQGSHVVFTEKEEEILEKFITIKHTFRGRSDTDSRLPPDERLDLPADIGVVDNPERGIVAGQLIIQNRELEAIFAPAVGGVLELIGQQINLLFAEGLQSGTIFLSGGFSRNEYLHRQVRQLGARCGFKVVRSDDDNSSWTAVAKGAVLMGLGLDCATPPPNIGCPVNIGVLLSTRFRSYEHQIDQKYVDSFDKSDRARNHCHWIIKKGDLVTLEGKYAATRLKRKFNAGGNKTGIVKVLVSYGDLRRNGAAQSQAFLDSTHEIELTYDLSKVPKHVAKGVIHKVSSRGKSFHQAEMTLDVFVSHLYYSIELTCGKTNDILGGTGEAGFVLASKQVYFPNSNANRSTGIGSSFTAWGGSSVA